MPVSQVFNKKNWTILGIFFIYFWTFSYIGTILQQKCEKLSMWCHDSNSRPLDHQSPPITTIAIYILKNYLSTEIDSILFISTQVLKQQILVSVFI